MTTGGDGSGSGGSVSYSVGQIFYTIGSGSNGSVAQGVQQPYEISVLTAIHNTEKISLQCIVYPNPTHGKITLLVETDTFKNLCYKLYNMHGTLIREDKIENEETEIIMDSYSSSTYLLKILSGTLEIKTFKIIKH